MAFVVANLTDQQKVKLDQAGIPYVEIPAAIVPRFRALVPQGMSAEDALVRLVKIAILNGEIQTFDNAEGQAKQQRVAEKRQALVTELGLG